MKTIEVVRLENFQTLIGELERELGQKPDDKQVSERFGISKVYAWQLRTGKREKIERAAARKIEGKAQKSVGWLDTDWAGLGYEAQATAASSTSPSSLESALQVLGQWIESTDDLQRDQVRPLINRMFDEPKRSPEIVARISATVSASIPSSKKVGNEEMPSFLKPK